MKNNKEPKYDLGVAGKFALYDRKTGTKITDFEYDRIISNYGEKHIVLKCENHIDENGNHIAGVGNITYSAIADSDGNLKEITGYILGVRGGFNAGVCIAYDKKTKKFVLMNDSGKVLSSSYPKLKPVNQENIYGLYNNIEFTQDGKLKKVDIISENGSPVEFKPVEINYQSDYRKFLQVFRFPEIDTLKKATDAIKKYGANIIEFLPNSIFETRANYLDLMYAVNDYVEKKNRNVSEMLYAIGLLTNILTEFSPEKIILPDLKLPKKIAGGTEYLQNRIKEYITQFYNVLS